VKEYVQDRRQFIKILLSLPVVSGLVWDEELLQAAVKTSPLSSEESLRKLLLLIGPWSTGNLEQAEDFIHRFLRAEQGAGVYLPKAAGLVQSLARRFPDDRKALAEIDLSGLPEQERQLLLKISIQLYSYVEVRFMVAGEPRQGECQDDRLRYTRPPAWIAGRAGKAGSE
jgi:hypothetical protein